MLNKLFPISPPHPERLCWGCDRYCRWDQLACGNGADRTAHPIELFGDDWVEVLQYVAEPKKDDSEEQVLIPTSVAESAATSSPAPKN